MDYSTVAQGLAHDEDGVLFDVHSLYSHLLQVADRRKRRGRRYTLGLILLVIVLAKLAGEDKPSGIADWARARMALLVKAFDLPRPRLPSHNTYRRSLGAGLSADELDEHLRRFLGQLPSVGSAVQVALDGKTVRGTIAFGQTHGLHLLAAYLPGQGVVLMQVAVDGQENEIRAAPRVLEMLDLQGKTPAPPSGTCRDRRCAVGPARTVCVDCRRGRRLCVDRQGQPAADARGS